MLMISLAIVTQSGTNTCQSSGNSAILVVNSHSMYSQIKGMGIFIYYSVIIDGIVEEVKVL